MVSPYIDSVNPDYVDWYVYARKALPFEDLLENTYTCLNYLAMFAELVVFLEIFLKKENRRHLSWKVFVPAAAIDGVAYILFSQYAKQSEHCSLYMPMVPWVLIAVTLTVFLVQIQRRAPDREEWLSMRCKQSRCC